MQVTTVAGFGLDSPVLELTQVYPGLYTFQLVVTDGNGGTGSTSATAFVNLPPTAVRSSLTPMRLSRSVLGTANNFPGTHGAGLVCARCVSVPGVWQAINATVDPVSYTLFVNVTRSSDPEDPTVLLSIALLYYLAPDAVTVPTDSQFVAVGSPGTAIIKPVDGSPGVYIAEPSTVGTHWFKVVVTDTAGGKASAVTSVTTSIAVSAGADGACGR